jgi:membrane-associated phospholipid phosphatase
MSITRRLLAGLVVVFAVVASSGHLAAAQSERSGEVGALDPSYLVDGGALPFLWLPLAASFAIDKYWGPRESPLAFSSGEGGATSRRSDEIHGAWVSVGAGAAAAALALGGDDSRWFHLKGFAQSLAVTSLLTATAKRVFSRRRPDYDGSAEAESDSKSFPSGHASQTAAAVTYLALFLHQHAFDRVRKPGSTPWWEVATYAGLGALALGVPAERVLHKRHHLTDVAAGSLLGAASSVGFFLFQERRYRRVSAGGDATEAPAMPAPALAPVDGPQVNLSFSF